MCHRVLREPCCEQWEGSFPGSLTQQLAKGEFGKGGEGLWKGGENREWGGGIFFCFFVFLESEMAGTRVAVVVELLLDVDHVATGVLQLSELGSATEVSKVAELGQP